MNNIKSIKKFLSRRINHLKILPEKIIESIYPEEPEDIFLSQTKSFGDYLPYEEFYTIKDAKNRELDICILEDGSFCSMWEIQPIEHEMIKVTQFQEGNTKTEFEEQIQVFVSAFEKRFDPNISYQVIYDSEIGGDFEKPDYVNHPVTTAQQVMIKNIESFKTRATNTSTSLNVTKRKIYLTMRVLPEKRLSLDDIYENTIFSNSSTQVFEREAKLFHKDVENFELQADVVEKEIQSASIKIKMTRMNANNFIMYMRKILHSSQSEKETYLQKENILYDKEKRLSKQLLKDFIEMTPKSIGFNNEVIECISLVDRGSKSFCGNMTNLLKIPENMRIVVNIRPCNSTIDLLNKSYWLKDAEDMEGQILKESVNSVQEKIARGNKLFYMSFHVFIRNKGTNIKDIVWDGKAKNISTELSNILRMDFVHEKFATPAIFYLCLPFCFSKNSSEISGREERVSSDILSHYLPLYGGFQGTSGRRGLGQLMQNRAGEPIWLNQKDASGNSHLCIYAGSGSGKSFYNTNRMTSQLALNPNSIFFILDYLTSYEVWANVMGETEGVQTISPPINFPNIFRGQLESEDQIDEEDNKEGLRRLDFIVSTILTAVELVSPYAQIGAIENTLLMKAIKKSFDQAYMDATSDFMTDFESNELGKFFNKKAEKIKIPRMRDVVANLPFEANELGISDIIVKKLSELLSPFMKDGPYANIFDIEDYEDYSEPSPKIFVYNLDGVLEDKILGPLTSQIIICEIMRQIKRKENKGKTGEIVIEEAGVIGSSSQNIAQFIIKAWKTFRKRGFSCVGISNEVSDFSVKLASAAMWNTSSNKVILCSSPEEINSATKGTKVGNTEVPPIVTDRFYGEVIRSLKKIPGEYSQAFWMSQEATGTFHYAPNGFSYWLAANNEQEKESFKKVLNYFSKYPDKNKRALFFLAEHFPFGVSDEYNNSAVISNKMIESKLQEKNKKPQFLINNNNDSLAININ